MKRYNLTNNICGWLAFAIAAATYLLTVEPTASFWDCPEFIAQGFKLEIGHPPGNPIFMLAARFFVTLSGGGAQQAAIAVNSMSALLSAGTILLLFWTVTHLTRRLIVRDDKTITAAQTFVAMAAGFCGALAYAWSDTFWFSAVEGEVYAFSSFCTALVIWLILKWENRADLPHSDRWLVLIAYVIGVSIAVHLLNLLCIPAIVLVFYYRKTQHATVKGSLLALALSFVIVFFILYGLVPGFISVAQRFELLFVNVLGLPFNSGVLAYAVLTLAVFVFTIWQLYRQKNAGLIKTGVMLSIVLSGMPFVGHSWQIPTLLILALGIYLLVFCKTVPVRVFNVTILSIFVIFIGYSSYALLLIRASADTPMNQNSPDNVFALASYLNREQYGDRPLFYGQTVAEELATVPLGTDADGNMIYGCETDPAGNPQTRPVKGVVYDNAMPVDHGTDQYTKAVKTDPSQPDSYVRMSHRPDYEYSADMMMLLPRMYSPDEKNVRNYKSWSEYVNPDFENIPVQVRQQWAADGYVTLDQLRPYLQNQTEIDMGTGHGGEPYNTTAWKMGVMDNLRFFVNYQLNHMYWRYFMWNFAGRQNDLQGNGEPYLGNWISGIPAIDNMRLGDQSQLPDEYGKDNAGHNVFYMLPLLLGLIGLLWQALWPHFANPRRGIEQFWVVFFLFFMTGIAIVIYLNQTAPQPRERDYAFAGSFYAYAIWIGLGVAAIANMLQWLIGRKVLKGAKDGKTSKAAVWTAAGIAAVFAAGVPLQMVSQTWDDHDRSGRYTTRDFGMNYLNSLDPGAIVFTNGDNDTFPLWYAQEVEGCRTDVRVINLSYLATDWYAAQQLQQTYEGQPVPMYAGPADFAYDSFWMQRTSDPSDSAANAPRDAAVALPQFYAGTAQSLQRLAQKYGLSKDEQHLLMTDANMYARLDSAATFATFGAMPETADDLHGGAYLDLKTGALPRQGSLSTMLTYDIIAKTTAEGFKRPVYFATTVPNQYALGFNNNLQTVGMVRQLTPFEYPALAKLAQKGYVNVVTRFKWGNLDSGKKIYLDETVRRMVSSTRLAVLDIIDDLLAMPDEKAGPEAVKASAKAGLPKPADQLQMARNLLLAMDKHLPQSAAPYESMLDLKLAETYLYIWSQTNDRTDLDKGLALCRDAIARYGALMRYADSLTPAKRNQFASGEKQALSYAAIAVGFENYAALRQAMLKAGAPEEEMAALYATLSLDRSFEAYNWLYVRNTPDNQLEEAMDYDRSYHQSAASALVLSQLHAKYGVDRMQRSKQAAKDMRMDMTTWLRTAR